MKEAKAVAGNKAAVSAYITRMGMVSYVSILVIYGVACLTE